MRAFLVATLMVALTLAGCLESGSESGDELIGAIPTPVWVTNAAGAEVASTAYGGDLPRLDLIHVTDRISGEPTIGITPDGAAFYASIAFDLDVPAYGTLPTTILFRSTDNGTTWEDKSPQIAGERTHPYSFDPYVYVDPTTGRVYALDMGPHVLCNKVSWSDDLGETWMTREGACPTPAADHPTLFAGPATAITNTLLYPNNLYLCSNQVAQSKCAISPDGGLSWLPSTPVFAEPVKPAELVEDWEDVGAWLCGSLTGHGHASWADGTVYLPKGHCGVPMVGVSHDGGLTWDQVVVAEGEEYMLQDGVHEAIVATDTDGVAYYFWIGGNGTRAFVSVSRDSGVTWETPLDVTAPGVTAAKLPSITAGDAGRIAFLYVGTTTPSGWDVHEFDDEGDVVMTDELRAATWNAYVGMSLNAQDADPIFATTLAHPADQPLKRGSCHGRCFGDVGGMYDFFDIEIDPTTGKVWTALVDVCTGACDEAGADAETEQIAKGTVGVQVGGITLLG